MNTDVYAYIIKEVKQEYEQKLYEERELKRLYKFLFNNLNNNIEDGYGPSDIYNHFDREVQQYLLNLPYDNTNKNLKNIMEVVYEIGLDIEGILTSTYNSCACEDMDRNRENVQKIINLFNLIGRDYTYKLEELDKISG